MIHSMTGFGSASAAENGISYRAEIRSVNNRYFKATVKVPEPFQRFEAEIDRQLREGLGRGSITLNLRVRGENSADGYDVNMAALGHYVKQLEQLVGGHSTTRIDLASLLDVPGVCEPAEIDESELLAQFAVVQRLIGEAIGKLIAMRRVEGASLEKDLREQCAGIRARLKDVAARRPMVVEEYHKKLRQRVQQLVAESSATLDQDALAREVAIFAERCDINEEISRLESHIDQFLELCASKEQGGRKLDFLAQEMLREANTIGSKANDAPVARHVVEIKAAIDRIKEQVQNVE